MSGLPRARTETLYALEAVAERNKPVAPPKKPEAAPFFLPSEMDAQKKDALPPAALPPPPPEFDAFAGSDGDGSDAGADEVVDVTTEGSRCTLAELSLADDALAVVMHLGTLGASAVDAEIALLCRGSHDKPGVELVKRFASHLATTLETHGHFDAVQAYLHRLVQHHAAVLSLASLRGPLTVIAAAQRDAAKRFRGLMHENLCLLETSTTD